MSGLPPSQPAAARTRAQLQATAAAAAQAAGDAAAAAAVRAPVMAPGGQAERADPLALFVQLMQQQQLQAVAMQTQQALVSAKADLAAAEALAQQRRAGAGPPPLFHGARGGDDLAVNTWLDALESWFALAHIDVDSDAERIEVAVASLRGAAQQWWAATRANDAAGVAAGGATSIDKWTGTVALLKKHYLPQDPARWAIQQLVALTNGRNADVQAYTNRFLQLDLMITGQRNELERLMSYEQGLPESYRVKSAEKQHTTLAAAVASSLALWNAKSVARAQSISHHGPSGATRLNYTQSKNSDNEGDAAESEHRQHSTSAASSSTPSSSALERKLEAMQAQLSAMQMQSNRNYEHGEGSSRRGRGGRRDHNQREGASNRPARSKTPGVSEELAKQRLQARVCIKCAEAGHYARDCTNELKTN
jgi:hypothetical protein